jgi:hypothetical protein
MALTTTAYAVNRSKRKNIWFARGRVRSQHYAGWWKALARVVPIAYARSKKKKAPEGASAGAFLAYSEHEVTHLYGKRYPVEAAAQMLLPSFDRYLKGSK